MFSSNYRKFCYSLLGDRLQGKNFFVPDKLGEDLLKANLNIREEAYIACALFIALIGVCIGIGFIILGIIILPLIGIQFSLLIKALILLSPLLLFGGIYFYFLIVPRFIANSRAKKIDLHMPYALNFIAAMSAAGVNPSEIIKSLSRQDIYGEVSTEALLMDRDISLLGEDIVSVFRKAVKRTPSSRFREFLQGAVVTITSGGALKPYFKSKADQYMRENKQTQRKFNESLGTMAEAYVTAAVAGVLMIMIIIPLMIVISGSASELIIMYLFVFVVLPLIHLGFAITIQSMTPEV